MNAIAGFVQHVEESRKPKKKAPRTRMKAPKTVRPLTAVEIAMDDAKRRASSGDWENAKGSSFVGLYCICHKMIYGVVPLELDQPMLFRAAGRMAVKAQRDMFNDDTNELAEFVRWSWEREKKKNDWAQRSGVDRNRLSWKWQFSAGLVTDYRIARSQKRY